MRAQADTLSPSPRLTILTPRVALLNWLMSETRMRMMMPPDVISEI
jgi:hypothetical protein